MKKLSLLIITLSSAFLLSGCGGTNSSSPSSTSIGDPLANLGPNEYAAQVLYPNGEVFNGTGLYAQWCDGQKCSTLKPFDSDGIAKITIESYDTDALVIHLVGTLPQGYTYNGNIYKSTTASRVVKINLVATSEASQGDGTLQNPYYIEDSTYIVDPPSNNTDVYYSFKPTKLGTYTFESWAYTVNPAGVTTTLSYYGNDDSPSNTVSSGGVDNNFKFEITVDSLDTRYLFAVKSTQDDSFPLNISFSE